MDLTSIWRPMYLASSLTERQNAISSTNCNHRTGDSTVNDQRGHGNTDWHASGVQHARTISGVGCMHVSVYACMVWGCFFVVCLVVFCFFFFFPGYTNGEFVYVSLENQHLYMHLFLFSKISKTVNNTLYQAVVNCFTSWPIWKWTTYFVNTLVPVGMDGSKSAAEYQMRSKMLVPGGTSPEVIRNAPWGWGLWVGCTSYCLEHLGPMQDNASREQS